MSRWLTDGYDIHLVGPAPGQPGQRQYNLATFFQRTGTGAAPTFEPVFAFTQPNHGLSVAPNGTLTFDGNALPSNRDPVRNFVVTAKVPFFNSTIDFPVRIHRHDELDEVVITPETLTIRRSANKAFSVLATFKDKVGSNTLPTVADITRQPGMQWSLAPGAPAQTLDVAATGMLTALAAGQTVSVQVVLPDSMYPANNLPSVADRTKTATVSTAVAWDAMQPADYVIELKRGRGVSRMNDVLNILFLPDGIQDRVKFEKLVQSAIFEMSTFPQAQPFPGFVVKESINFWMGWLDSPEEGGTNANELRPPAIDEFARTSSSAVTVVPANPIAASAMIANIADLNFRVGLPTAAAKDLNFVNQRLAWTALYTPNHFQGVTEAIWREWVAASARTLLREKDTALGLVVGDRPRLPPSVKTDAITWHPLRTRRSDLDKYLGKVTTASGGQQVNVGHLWTTAGKANVVIGLTNSPNERGTNTAPPEAIAAFTLTSHPDVELDDDLDESQIGEAEIPPLKTQLGKARVGVIIHELGHSFHLGDEYTADAKDFTLGADLRHTKRFWNVVVPAEITVTQQIVAAKIRWSKWPRIVAAGIVKVDPQVTLGTPNQIVIDLKPGHGRLFSDALFEGKIASDGRLRFRKRPLVQLDQQSVDDSDLEVLSPFMTIDGVQGDQVTASCLGDELPTWLVDVTVDPAAGNIILLASKEEDGEEQFLLDPNGSIAGFIEGNGPLGGPLNRVGSVACALPAAGKGGDDQVTILPTTVGASKLKTLIGLYDGGMRHSCEIFHAAGACAMRTHHLDGSDLPPNVDELTRKERRQLLRGFCHVCRYILVDQIDPTLHGVIDTFFPVVTFPE